ncbi:ABC transporter, ATP-binding protein [Nitrospirillum viridazoti Y2]|uniref:Probable ATP-binding protein YheS n=1 Tax=Nitrospirillum amazonense TaxID=28077 RepID=A0A560IL42_9PROT|nr:ABC-F family ATP-binding cassette domain-containing protein [Nitrospirillum amazonense]EGY01752.1 ABC transporter, ATP-binding protein [Nitrospirillum amazonense Y2]TWB59758.1 ATP-binding cassette subfamily F protein 3 [Nitrospirillum amazonense]
MLTITDLTYRIAGRTLLDQASVVVPRGHKVALVGRNGTGKSTLFKLIAGELHPDGGEISLPSGMRMGMVRQEVPAGATSLLDTVMAADTERTALLAEAETATDPARIAEVHTRLADIGAHSAEARAAQILSGLGFDAAAQQRACADFSGGWRMRVALAGVLFTQPDLLLLDEPTNHLDLEATVWLESYLKNYPHTILLISHDRELLNKVPTTTIHLDQQKLTSYSGGYDQFVTVRAAKLENLKAQSAKQEAQRKHMQDFVDRFRAKASKAKQAQSRLKALEKLGPAITVLEEHRTRFDFPSPEELSPPLINMDGAVVGYGDKAILRNLNLRIDPEDRIALLGANGNGKSTLVKMLAGRLAPMGGEVRRSSKLKVGYFAQHQAEELNLAWTPVQQTQAAMKGTTEQQVRNHLGRFGFPQVKADTLIRDLSGGEKARLLFALMSREAPGILLLDEPTNHLDIDSREALVEAINGYQGAVILISHDPHLVELTADRLWLVADGTCKPYDGDLDEYRAWLLDQRRSDSASRDVTPAAGRDRKEERRAAAELRQQLAPLRRKVEDAEKRMGQLGTKKAKLDEKLADPALYQGPKEAVTKLQIELGQVQKDLDAAEEAWLTLSEQLEEAMAAGS